MLFFDSDIISEPTLYKYKDILLGKYISEKSGIYIWRFQPKIKLETLESDLSRLSSLNIFDYSELNNSSYSIKLEKKYFKNSDTILGLSKNKEKDLLKIINNLKNIKQKESLVSFLNLIFKNITPLYIGKSKNLKERLESHINRNTSLIRDIEKIGIDLKKEIVIEVYTIANEPEIIIDNESIFEEMLQRITSPILTKRYG